MSNGLVYVGTRSGYLYALNESTGAVVWQQDLGYVNTGCQNQGSRGLTATPDVVAGTVYEAGATGSGLSGGIALYALNAATGGIERSTTVSTNPASYAWGSPTVVGANVYVGVSSACDKPLVPGSVVEVNGATGAIESTFDTVPAGTNGGGVWTTPASDGTDIWTTTGNGPGTSNPGNAGSMVHLTGSLAELNAFKPQTAFSDADWGSSPVLFNNGAEQLIGACDKDGYFYALRRETLALAWRTQIDARTGNCQTGAVYGNGVLYQASDGTDINGKSFPGSVRALNVGTGAPLWQAGLPIDVTGTPTLNGAGVLAVPGLHGAKGVILLNASTGQRLSWLEAGSSVYAQPVWADSYLIVASESAVTAYAG